MSGYDRRDRERYVGEDPAQKQADRDDFARDRARVLHSAALRRLAAKTQVVAPGRDDFSRNRLTHSLEVAQIGREVGGALGCNADVVDMACLAHDLGHPPFGHNGERALHEVAADIGGFEGNAQTFRILTRLEAKRAIDGRSVGLNLTRACLDAATKYPWRRGERPGTAKFGCYADDAEIFEWVRADVPQQTPHRLCVEAQVMDWSDDVAYSVHDVEDGITAGLIDLPALRSRTQAAELAALAQQLYAADLPAALLEESWCTLVDREAIPRSHSGGRADVAALKDMTSRLIGRFVGAVEAATRERHHDGPLTRYGAHVVIPDDVRAECAMLKAVSAHYVMLTDDRVQLLERQRAIIHALAEVYRAHPHRLDPMFAEDFAAAGDDGARLRVVVDQIAALTDPRATMLAREWT